MKILVCGANGFVGRHIVAMLKKHGHQLVLGVSRATKLSQQATDHEECVIDFAKDSDIAVWLPRLQGIDVVINAVGILRDSSKRPMQAIHVDTPQALFAASASVGVQYVIHVSALGIANNNSKYATTKRKAETFLLQHINNGTLKGMILRPSVVFGEGGESSRLMLLLASLPALILPTVATTSLIQPVHVQELAEAVARLLAENTVLNKEARSAENNAILELLGSEAVPFATVVASLRSQQGKRAAKLWRLPNSLSRLSARLGDIIPVTPWGTDTLTLLSSDNSGDVTKFSLLLGRVPTHYSQLLSVPAFTAED